MRTVLVRLGTAIALVAVAFGIVALSAGEADAKPALGSTAVAWRWSPDLT